MSDIPKSSSIVPNAVPFQKGFDPRRNLSGRIRPELAAAREALLGHLPRAIEIFGQLLEDEDPRIRLAAAGEIRDTVMGKPKTADIDIENNVRAELAVVFARLRERVAPEVYAEMLRSVAEDAK